MQEVHKPKISNAKRKRIFQPRRTVQLAAGYGDPQNSSNAELVDVRELFGKLIGLDRLVYRKKRICCVVIYYG